jgi:pyruvate/2-oxoacid:ferredoxin oxidoreductase alpha subunit
MKTKVYTLLGWMAWQGITIVVGRKVLQNKVKIGAAATVLGVLAAGLVAAKATSSGDE